jgi:hypothetical protein
LGKKTRTKENVIINVSRKKQIILKFFGNTITASEEQKKKIIKGRKKFKFKMNGLSATKKDNF